MKIQLVPNELSAKIKVLGVGGAGGNAINDMISSQMVGVDFIAANTDAQALERSLAPVKIQLGPDVTRGLGAGGDPEVGRNAALEDAEHLKQVLQGADMVFIAAGLMGAVIQLPYMAGFSICVPMFIICGLIGACIMFR